MQQGKLSVVLGLSSVLLILANPAQASIQVDEVSINQFQGRGCGMTLWKVNRKASDRYVLFNGLQSNTMEMSLNGKMRKFTRIKGSGQQFYGQKTSQTFQDHKEKIMVEVNVELGKKTGAETIAISKGTIRVKRNQNIVSFAVRGNAGC